MASAWFRIGSTAIPVGEIEFDISFPSVLPDTPDSVQPTVRQPSADSDIINAYLVGAPTASGFRVTLSSPVESEGYRIDWVAFKNGESSPAVAGDTLAVCYDDLKKLVARFLGYDTAHLTEAQTDEVDDCIQSGIRNYYYPSNIEGVDPNFEWSFIRQSGSLTTEAGVAEYTLPDGFGRIAGQLTYDIVRHGPVGGIPVIPYGDIKVMLERNPALRNTPRFAATISLQSFGSRGQEKKIVFFPTPDREYDIGFVCDADTGKIDPVNRPFPLGGAMHAELIRESCLASAEQLVNDEVGQHTQKFASLLASIVAKDRKSGAQSFGRVGDPDAFNW